MLDENQTHRLAGMAHALRPDWPLRSLITFIDKNLTGRAYRDVAVALTYIACDPKTLTPKRILESGPWWRATNAEGETANRPPRREESCETCGRRETEHASTWLADHPYTPLAYATQHRTQAPTGLRAEIQHAVSYEPKEGAA